MTDTEQEDVTEVGGSEERDSEGCPEGVGVD